MEPIRYGIIGTGTTVGIARNHILGLNQCRDIKLSAIYDIDEKQAQRTYEECGLTDTVICKSWEELLEHSDAIGICLPNSLHVEYAVRGLQAGKHVLIEKPVSTDAESLKELLDEEKKHAEQVAMVCFNYREFPIYQQIRKILDAGDMGQIYRFHLQLGGNRIANKQVGLEWRMDRRTSGPGAISDFGCHLLDIIHYLLEPSCGPITELKALLNTCIPERRDLRNGSMQKVTNDDNGVFIGKMENGAVFSCDTSRVGMWRHSIEISGEGGMVYGDFDEDDQLWIWKKEKEGSYQSREKLSVSGLQGHAGILQNFADCIQGKAVNHRTVTYAGKVQAMIDSMERTGNWRWEDKR